MSTFCFATGAAFLVIGLLMEAVSVFGIYRFGYSLNRKHSAAIGDTLAIGNIVIGLCIISGFSVTTLKLLAVIVFFWLAGPVSSHLLVRLEVTTNERIEEHAPEKEVA